MVKFVVIAFDDTWFKLSEGKILAYNYASLSEEDKKPESDYKPGALFYFSDLESLVPGMDSMLKQGESSSFMATDITVSENGTKAVIEGQQDAGMFFIPETLEFEVGVPTTNSTIFDSANPSQEFTLTPTAIYDTPEGLLNWRQEMDALKGKPLKAAESHLFEAEFRRRGFGRDIFVPIDDTELAIHNGKGRRVGKIAIDDENDDNVVVIVDGYDANKNYDSQPLVWDGVLNAEVDVGEKQVRSRKDYDINNEVDIDDLEIGDIDLSPYEDEIVEQLNDEIVEAIKDSVDSDLPLEDGETGSDSVEVSTDITLGMDVPIEGTVSFDWTANENYEDNPESDDWAAESEMETCAECGMEVDEDDIVGDGTNRGLCCVPDYYDAENDETEWVTISATITEDYFQDLQNGDESWNDVDWDIEYSMDAETFEAEFVFNVADTSGESNDVHTYFVEAKDKDTAEEMLAVMIEDDYPGMSYEIMEDFMSESESDFFSAEEMKALDELHMES